MRVFTLRAADGTWIPLEGAGGGGSVSATLEHLSPYAAGAGVGPCGNCGGCCDGEVCRPGWDDAVCGSGGKTCVACVSPLSCVEGHCGCPPGSTACGGACCAAGEICGTNGCGPATCPAPQTCGLSPTGTYCGECGEDQYCNGLVCVPVGEGEATCTDGGCPGCCDENGAGCYAGNTATHCGTGGSGCVECSAETEQCLNNVCESRAECGPENCAGCCDGELCKLGTSDTACGMGGVACQACDCHSGSCDTPAQCGPANCAGCCSRLFAATCEIPAAQALPPLTRTCGLGGVKCDECEDDETCEGGVCTKTGCLQTCEGCCDRTGVCQPGDTDLACGNPGELCRACPAMQRCVDGDCERPGACGETTCAGCCNNQGACVTGDSPNACGIGGATCEACDDYSECVLNVCVKKTCECTGAGQITNISPEAAGCLYDFTCESWNAAHEGQEVFEAGSTYTYETDGPDNGCKIRFDCPD